MGLFDNVQKTALGGLFAQASTVQPKKSASQRTVVAIPKEQDSKASDESQDDQEEEEEEEVEAVEHTRKRKRADDDDLEGKYIAKLLAEEDREREQIKKEKKATIKTDDQEDKDEKTKNGEDNEQGEVQDEEGTIITQSATSNIDLKDIELDKAERTLFVGNVPASVMKDKKLTKQFKRVFSEYGKLDSIRFRSIQFNSSMPRKFAYITKSFNDTKKDTSSKQNKNEMVINSYVVFSEKSDSLKASNKLNGHIFLDHHLRVDHLSHPLKQDNRKSIFIGNLDFEEVEESLWKYFNNKIGGDDDDESDENIIDNVRIIRDPKVNIGKGFAIVQFKDSIYVDKALLLDGKTMNNRKLRISRCKKMNNSNNSRNNDSNSKFKFSDKQKTIIGRGKKVLNKSDRATIGGRDSEGYRAKKGDSIRGIKNGLGSSKGPNAKKPRHSSGRVAKRAKAFRNSKSDAK